ncbi:glycerol kinase GlpK [Nocardia caishijiensis]|uniref:ATP:glycerol 3-phosphotransferase n=1 Tax=Nocardia caishijiensis TaxID=184756 RepID=A0ABQ6YHJ4_9NOCA|nr:glycerol kinase GlpK [Nocardia caishijiensis]KAF0845260.1 glycerol kinase [Nocardia caishijiensis]
MTPRFVLAIDQGTTSSRCLVFDRHARLAGLAQRVHRQHYPRSGWVEQDALEIWRTVERLLPAALRDAGIGVDQVAAVGIANQRETTVVWDRATGIPVRPAIVWQDIRTEEFVESLRASPAAQRITELSGLPLATYFAAPRLRWLLDHVEGLRERAERGDVLFGTMESWLVWNLTGGVHVTDVTNACRTLLMNLTTRQWDEELLRLFDIPRAMLPRIEPSTGDFGTAVTAVPGVRIGAALGDQHAALFGQTCFAPGETECTYGTGGFLMMNTGTELIRSRHGLLTTIGYQVGADPVYALEGPIAVTGSLVGWLRDIAGLIATAPEIETLADTVDDNGGCYLVPAFSGLYAPHWRSDARGLLIGLTSYVTKGHLARAALEATAWQTRDVLEAMNADAGLRARSLRVAGGMTSNNLLMQIIADVLDIPVTRPLVTETVSLGAAYAAGLAVGYWPDLQGLRSNWRAAAQWVPHHHRSTRDDEYEHWQRAVQLSIGWSRTSHRSNSSPSG